METIKVADFYRYASQEEPLPGQGLTGLSLLLQKLENGEYEINFPEDYTQSSGPEKHSISLRFHSLDEAQQEFRRIRDDISDCGYQRL